MSNFEGCVHNLALGFEKEISELQKNLDKSDYLAIWSRMIIVTGSRNLK